MNDTDYQKLYDEVYKELVTMEMRGKLAKLVEHAGDYTVKERDAALARVAELEARRVDAPHARVDLENARKTCREFNEMTYKEGVDIGAFANYAEVALPVALTEIEYLRHENQALTDALLASLERKISDTTLIQVMRTRYGRDARRWQANYDQRKAERDAAIAGLNELREHYDEMEAGYTQNIADLNQRIANQGSAALKARMEAGIQRDKILDLEDRNAHLVGILEKYRTGKYLSEAGEARLAELQERFDRLADAAQHCRACLHCGDGPCCDLCKVEAIIHAEPAA